MRLVQYKMFLHGYNDVRQKLDMKISRLISTEGEVLHLGCYLGSCHESEAALSGSGVRRLPWQLQASLREAELQLLPSRCHGCRSKWLASLLESIADLRISRICKEGFGQDSLAISSWPALTPSRATKDWKRDETRERHSRFKIPASGQVCQVFWGVR